MEPQKFNWASHIEQKNNSLLCTGCGTKIEYQPPPVKIPEEKKERIRWRRKLKNSIDTIWDFLQKHKFCYDEPF